MAPPGRRRRRPAPALPPGRWGTRCPRLLSTWAAAGGGGLRRRAAAPGRVSRSTSAARTGPAGSPDASSARAARQPTRIWSVAPRPVHGAPPLMPRRRGVAGWPAGAGRGNLQLHGIHRDAPDLGDLLVRQAVELAQQQHRPELDGQLGHRPVQYHPVGDQVVQGGTRSRGSGSSAAGPGRRPRRRTSSIAALVATR